MTGDKFENKFSNTPFVPFLARNASVYLERNGHKNEDSTYPREL